jgi:hypothetical protein
MTHRLIATSEKNVGSVANPHSVESDGEEGAILAVIPRGTLTWVSFCQAATA